MSDWSVELKGHCLEFLDSTHTYVCDGVIIPSVTSILQQRFGGRYSGISKRVLDNAASKGTAVHEAIEAYCGGTFVDIPEVKNFRFLQRMFSFNVMENEKPVLLFKDGRVVAAGRYDLQLMMDGKIGGADIKRTSALDREYVAYQLNLYRIAARQTYDVEWEFLRAIHLRDETRRFVELPINEAAAMDLVDEYLKARSEE